MGTCVFSSFLHIGLGLEVGNLYGHFGIETSLKIFIIYMEYATVTFFFFTATLSVQFWKHEKSRQGGGSSEF